MIENNIKLIGLGFVLTVLVILSSCNTKKLDEETVQCIVTEIEYKQRTPSIPDFAIDEYYIIKTNTGYIINSKRFVAIGDTILVRVIYANGKTK